MSLPTYTIQFSSKGGDSQGLHIDEIRENCHNKESIHSVIVALESDTKLDFSISCDKR